MLLQIALAKHCHYHLSIRRSSVRAWSVLVLQPFSDFGSYRMSKNLHSLSKLAKRLLLRNYLSVKDRISQDLLVLRNHSMDQYCKTLLP